MVDRSSKILAKKEKVTIKMVDDRSSFIYCSLASSYVSDVWPVHTLADVPDLAREWAEPRDSLCSTRGKVVRRLRFPNEAAMLDQWKRRLGLYCSFALLLLGTYCKVSTRASLVCVGVGEGMGVGVGEGVGVGVEVGVICVRVCKI